MKVEIGNKFKKLFNSQEKQDTNEKGTKKNNKQTKKEKNIK